MFNLEFLKLYPEFGKSEGVNLTLLPARLKPRPLEEVIRDDEELDTKIKSEKKKIPESPEAVVFLKADLLPNLWFDFRLGSENVKIIDAVPDAYTDIMQLLFDHYLPYEPLCKAMRVHDDAFGLNDFRKRITFLMNGSASLVAVDSDDNIIGVLIGTIEDLDECTDEFDQSIVYQSKRIQTIQNVVIFMTKYANIYEKYNVRAYYRICAIAVHKDKANRGIEKALITGALRLCFVTDISLIAGVFTMYKDQYYLKQFGANVELEAYYSEWKTDRGLRIFRGTGKTEPKATFMTLFVPESFEPSAIDPKLEPLTSDRARRRMMERLPVWDELDVYRACQCKPSQKRTE